jgi:tRNA A-37 threonylcarbamoyl transferase component Bud32
MLDISHPSSCYCAILSALRFVHNHNISHNNDDVRLPNIVVELKNGKATLIDWGNAKMDATMEEKMQDIMSLIRLFIINKYFHGFSSVLMTE